LAKKFSAFDRTMCLKNGSIIITTKVSLLFLYPEKHTLTAFEIFLENVEAFFVVFFLTMFQSFCHTMNYISVIDSVGYSSEHSSLSG
jgi:hypothetical protein